MENKSSSSGIMRSHSDQLVEKAAGIMKSPWVPSDWGAEMEGSSRKSMSRGGGISASPGADGSTSSRHTRKTRSAQMKFDVDELNSGATLSRASSASMGFSFTAFTVRPSDIADSRPFSDDDDDDIPEDIETGTLKKKIQTEPTLPIHLKASMEVVCLARDQGDPLNMEYH